MTNPVSIALVGLGGYGQHYLRALLNPETVNLTDFNLVAGIDPEPERSFFHDELQNRQVPLYATLDDFYAAGHADLVIIAAPIHLHAPMTKQALAQGSNVLCEKPATATIQELEQMRQAEDAAPGFVAIGFQWSFSAAIQALKTDVQAGVLGRPEQFKARIFWPRTAQYFARNSWAARLKTESGQWVLDSPVNNATAHYLHNCFFVLGDQFNTSALPANVQAELYRANPIENFDSAALRSTTVDGTEILFYTSHSVPQNQNPLFEYRFEQAIVRCDVDTGGEIIATFKDGSEKQYGNPNADDYAKVKQCIAAIREGGPIACGLNTARSLTLCVNGTQESQPDITVFPEDMRHRDGEGDYQLTWIEGLQEAFQACYDEARLPSETGRYTWAQVGRLVDLRDYSHFPQDERA